jgi:hypothetical protein
MGTGTAGSFICLIVPSCSASARLVENVPMEIIHGARLPIYSWASEIEAEALRQARNLGNLDVAVDHAALMPDAHSGFGIADRRCALRGVALSSDLVRPVTRLRPLGVVKG